VGLFDTVGDGATLENFTLEVSTADSIKTGYDSQLFFGGVVGQLLLLAMSARLAVLLEWLGAI
jgi:hypothetical protein